MKLYSITFSFLDPTKAMGTIAANSEEEAVNNLKAQLEGKVESLVIESVEEVTVEAASAETTTVAQTEATVH